MGIIHGPLNGAICRIHKNKPTTGDLTFVDCSCTMINNYGQLYENTQVLPPATSGFSFLTIISTTGNSFHIKPHSGEVIYLNGLPLAVDSKVSLLVPVVGNCAYFYCFQTGLGIWSWSCTTLSGNWISGGY